jgi:hypothetical protein
MKDWTIDLLERYNETRWISHTHKNKIMKRNIKKLSDFVKFGLSLERDSSDVIYS